MAVRERDFGELPIAKGTVGDISLSMWDKVDECMGVDCPHEEYCPYLEVKLAKFDKGGELGLCLVQKKYLLANTRPFVALIEKVQDEFVAQWCGMHLIPLYHDLVQLQMKKWEIENDNIVYTDDRGTKRIHPVFEEVRRTHTEILKIWKTTGLLKIARDAGYFESGAKIIPGDEDIEMGEKNGIVGGYEAINS